MSTPDFPHTSRPDVSELEARVKFLEARELDLLELIKSLEASVAAMEKDVAWLGDLENAGVDNWQGIDFAHELKRDREAEEAQDE